MCTPSQKPQAGISLIELIMFVVILGVAVAGVVSIFNTATQKSADPAARKQLQSIAEAMLQEVQLMPFTYCDPDDANAATAAAATVGGVNCAATVEAIGSEAAETRYNAANPFDNVNDYHGFDTNSATPSGIADLSGTVAGLTGYRAQVSVTAQSLGPGGSQLPANDGNGQPQSLLIDVTVTSPRGETLSLSGYRTRYAPNGVP